MYDYDKNIIALIEILTIENKISSKTEFYDEIKTIRQTISKIKKGINIFYTHQIFLPIAILFLQT